MKIKVLGLKILFATAFSLSAVAGATDKNVGTSSAQFLKIGAGARPTAMGDAFVAVADDVNSVYFNPAGIANLARPEFTAMHTQWIANTNYDMGAFSYPTSYGAFGLAAATLKTDDIQRRDVDETHTGDFKAIDASYSVSYAHNIAPQLALGVTARLIQQSIDSTSASTYDADFGVLKRFASSPASFGLAVKHLGKPVKFRKESDPLPMNVDLGAATELLDKRLLVSADGRWFRDNSPGYGLGLEYTMPLSDKNKFVLRGGYNSKATDADGSGITLGAGLGLGRLDLDFAWVPFGDLGDTFRYAAHMKF